MTFGEKLQTLRTDAGLSQEGLAARLGVSRQAISKWELNKTMPDVKYIVALSDLFQVTTDSLLKEQAAQTPPEPPTAAPVQDASRPVQAEPPQNGLFSGHTALTLLTCGNVLFLTLILLYIIFYCFAFRRLGLWPLLAVLLAAPVLLMASCALLGRASLSQNTLRQYRRGFSAGVTLWAFSIAFLCGYSEVADDLLVSQVEGWFSIPLFLAMTLGLSLLFWCMGQLLAHLITRKN